MNMLRTIVLTSSIAALACAAEPNLLYRPGEAARVLRYVRYLSLPRITPERLDMAPRASTLCVAPPTRGAGPHSKPGIHLYVNEPAIEKAKNWADGDRLPVGSLLVKEKFEAPMDSTPSIITVMEKIGNEGKIEDWLFYMLRLSDASIVREKTRVSCVECHAHYGSTDFVSKRTFSLLVEFAKRRPTQSLQPTPGS
jgi:hypothetical protein